MSDLQGSPVRESASDERRSTRLVIAVPVTASTLDVLGRFFREEVTTLDVSCFGCTYRSDRYTPKDAAVTLEIWREGRLSAPKTVEAQVKWVRRPKNHRENYKVALELKVPGNVWGVREPPADWFPHPDDIKLTREGIVSWTEGESLQQAPKPVDSVVKGEITIVPEYVAINSERAVVELEDTGSGRLAREIQAEIRSAFRGLVDRAADAATEDLMKYVAQRIRAAVAQATREGEATVKRIDAAIQEVLDSSINGDRARKQQR